MILRALWLRPTVSRPLRFLATVAGVAIGVAAVVSTLLASRAAVASLGADVEVVAGQAALEVRRPGGVDPAVLGDLRELAGEALIAPVVEDVAHVPALGDLARVLGVDVLVDDGVRAVELDFGERDPQEALDAWLLGRGVALSRGLAAELGAAPGDALEVLVRARPVALDVVAVFAPERFASAWDRVLLVDLSTAQELFARGPRLDRLELRPRTAWDPDAFAARVAERLPDGYRVAPASARRAEGERLVRALEFNLTALSGVSLLVGVVLVATTLATSIVQRRRAIALLRSLGASRAQLARAVLVEAAAIGTLGGLAGVAAGWGGARAALAGVRTTVATVAPEALAGDVRLEPRWLLLGLACGLLASLAAALLPLREALRVPPVQGLRQQLAAGPARREHARRALLLAALAAGAVLFARLPPLEDRPIWALLSSLLVLSTLLVLSAPLIDLVARLHPVHGALGGRIATSVRVAQAAVSAGRRRAAWAAAAVGVAVGLAVAMATMVGSFRTTVVEWTEQAMRSDLFVRPLPTSTGVAAGGIDGEVVAIAGELFGPEALDPFRATTAYVDDRPVALAGAAFGTVSGRGGVPFLDGRPSHEVFAEAARTGGAVVNEPFARRFGVGPGDSFELETAAGRVRRDVVGVYRDYSGHTGRVVLDREDYLGLFPDDGILSLAVYLPDAADVAAARAQLAAALAGRFAVEVLSNREIRGEVLAVFERTFAVTVALQLLAAAVAGLAVITVLGALVRERRGELAVLRTLGGSAGQVLGVVLGQALLLGAAGALGGLLVGLVMGYVLVVVVNLQSFGWTLQFVPPWGSLAATVGLVVPACLLAGLVPAMAALRQTPLEELRELG